MIVINIVLFLFFIVKISEFDFECSVLILNNICFEFSRNNLLFFYVFWFSLIGIYLNSFSSSKYFFDVVKNFGY